MSYDDNIYYSPEHYGLEILGEAADEPDWDFNMFVVWRDKDTGVLYYASDAGCSCPSPFEDYNSKEDLTKAESIQQIHDALDEWSSYSYSNSPEASAVELHRKLSEL